MIFISAGHNSQSKSIKADPGAVANGLKEGDLTIDFRDRVIKELEKRGYKYIADSDEENLSGYLSRIKPGSGSVLIEYHFDAAAAATATGTTGLVRAGATQNDLSFAKELSESTAKILGIRNRGVIDETQSHRGRLAFMRKQGILCLLELAFITNKDDIAAYLKHRDELAAAHADILIKYEDLIK